MYYVCTTLGSSVYVVFGGPTQPQRQEAEVPLEDLARCRIALEVGVCRDELQAQDSKDVEHLQRSTE